VKCYFPHCDYYIIISTRCHLSLRFDRIDAQAVVVVVVVVVVASNVSFE